MTFASEGNLVTDSREVTTSETWSTQLDWEAFQESNDIDIDNGVLKLSEKTADIIDTFEQYEPGGSAVLGDNYSGTGDAAVGTGGASEGDQYIYNAYTEDSDEGIASSSGMGLSNYVDQGDTVEIDMLATTTQMNDIILLFAIQDVNNPFEDCYSVWIRFDNQELRIDRRQNDSFNELSSTAASIPLDEWLTGELQWGNDDSIVWTAYDSTGTEIASTSTVDTTFSGTDGTVGYFFRNRSGQTDVGRVDNVIKPS